MKRRVIHITLVVFFLIAMILVSIAFVNLSPAHVLVYAQSDKFGPPLPLIARTRASLWSSCPAGAYAPTTPLGAVAASLEGSSPVQQKSILFIADAMLKNGCDINEFGPTGSTPLLDAVIYGDPIAVRTLLSLGSDPALQMKPAQGKAPNAITGMNARELAAYLLPQPTGPQGNRQTVLELLSQ